MADKRSVQDRYPKNEHGFEAIILGIDSGSTSTRGFIYNPVTGQGLEVNNLNANNLHPRYETGDFSSEGYIFDDDGPAYLGEEVDPMRKSCSLRYGFYALVKPLSNILQGFGLLDELMARKDDPVFLGRIRRGLAELFATVRKRVLQICAQKRYYIHTISLTIPAQWTLEFEDLYRDIIGEVFEHPRDHIWFNTEIEALVHYLFNYYRQELGFQAHGVDRLLITDHGGHVMSGVAINVIDGKAFCRIGVPFGASGGSEYWEYLILQECVRQLEVTYATRDEAFPPNMPRDLLDQFNAKKKRLGPESPECPDGVHLVYADGDSADTVRLRKDVINERFEEGFRGPLQVSHAKMVEFAKTHDANTRVVICGGGCRNGSLKVRLSELCAEAGLPAPLFIDSLPMETHRSWSLNIAKGATYAAANQLTVAEFIDSGATFALQRLQQPVWGKWMNSDRVWDNAASVLLDKARYSITLQSPPPSGLRRLKANSKRLKQHGVKRVNIYSNGRDEFKIICDPLRRAQGPDTEVMPLQDRCYDFLAFEGSFKRGWWTVELDLVDGGDAGSLCLKRTRRADNRGKTTDSTIFPVHFHGGSNSLFIGGRTGHLGPGAVKPGAKGQDALEIRIEDCAAIARSGDSQPATSVSVHEPKHTSPNSAQVAKSLDDLPRQGDRARIARMRERVDGENETMDKDGPKNMSLPTRVAPAGVERQGHVPGSSNGPGMGKRRSRHLPEVQVRPARRPKRSERVGDAYDIDNIDGGIDELT